MAASSTVRSALALAIGARVPVVLWGGPGVGKTSAIRDMARAAGLPCEIVLASIREPSDFAGLPVVGTGDTVHLAPPAWARRLADEQRGILFLDEITTAPPAVQAALMRVVLERTVGDLALPDTIAVVAAANPPEQAADGWDLAPPLANRFCHLEWRLDAQEFVHGISAGFENPPIPDLDDDELKAAEGTTRALVGGFLSARSGLLHAPPTNDAAAGLAWPSPRTWEMAVRLLAASHLASNEPVVRATLLAGCVGPGVAAEFIAWERELDLPDPEAVLADPDSLRLPPRSDRAFAVLGSIVAAVRANNTADRWRAAWRAVAIAAAQGQPDVAVASVRALVAERPEGAIPPPDVLLAMAPVLKQAGMFDRLIAPSS